MDGQIESHSHRVTIFSAQKPGTAEGGVKGGAENFQFNENHQREGWNQQLLPQSAYGTSSL